MRELPSPAVHASRNAFSLSSQAVRGLVIAVLAAVVLAYLGALGTQDAPFVQRLAYWAAVIVPGSLLGSGALVLVRHWGVFSAHVWLELLAVALLMSVPHSFVVIVVSAMFFGIGMITPMVVLQFWLAVLLIALVMTVINYLAHPRPAAALGPELIPETGPAPGPEPVREARALPLPVDAPEPMVQPAVATAPAMPSPGADPAPALSALPALLADKLPHRLRGGRLLAIEAEDHYLRVHTDLGSDLILMRMTDACALLDDATGARVHRSWWVARAAVVAASVQSGRMELALAGGRTAQVSRAMQPVLRRAGWL